MRKPCGIFPCPEYDGHYYLLMLVRMSVVCRSWQQAAQLGSDVPKLCLRGHVLTCSLVNSLLAEASDLHGFGRSYGRLQAMRLGAALASLQGLQRLTCSEFVPSELLPHSLQQLIVEAPRQCSPALARQLQLLVIGLPNLPCLWHVLLDVHTSLTCGLTSAKLAGVKLPQLETFEMHIRDGLYGTGPLDLAWLGGARSFTLRLELVMQDSHGLVSMLQRTLRPGDHLHWRCDIMSASSRRLLKRLLLGDLILDCASEEDGYGYGMYGSHHPHQGLGAIVSDIESEFDSNDGPL